MIKRSGILACLVIASVCAVAQNVKPACYPTNWWTGMKWNKLQIMVQSKEIGRKDSIGLMSYNGVTLKAVHKVEKSELCFH